MSGRGLLLLSAFGLAACAAPQGPPLVSARSPPSNYTQAASSEPEPLTSLPRGAANISPTPGAVAPNLGSVVLPGI